MFHIKITDLATGEVEIDTDATCIIWGVNDGKNSICVQYSDCSPRDFLLTALAAKTQAREGIEGLLLHTSRGDSDA